MWIDASWKSGKSADKPGSVERPCGRRAVIPLGDALPRRSSSLPGSDASHVDAPLFGLAPDGVCRAVRVATSAVSSYLTLSPSPDTCGRRRTAFCCHASPARVAPPQAVQVTWTGEVAPSGDTFHRFGLSAYGARPLAGILLYGARTFLDTLSRVATAWRTSRRRLSWKS